MISISSSISDNDNTHMTVGLPFSYMLRLVTVCYIKFAPQYGLIVLLMANNALKCSN